MKKNAVVIITLALIFLISLGLSFRQKIATNLLRKCLNKEIPDWGANRNVQLLNLAAEFERALLRNGLLRPGSKEAYKELAILLYNNPDTLPEGIENLPVDSFIPLGAPFARNNCQWCYHRFNLPVVKAFFPSDVREFWRLAERQPASFFLFLLANYPSFERAIDILDAESFGKLEYRYPFFVVIYMRLSAYSG